MVGCKYVIIFHFYNLTRLNKRLLHLPLVQYSFVHKICRNFYQTHVEWRVPEVNGLCMTRNTKSLKCWDTLDGLKLGSFFCDWAMKSEFCSHWMIATWKPTPAGGWSSLLFLWCVFLEYVALATRIHACAFFLLDKWTCWNFHHLNLLRISFHFSIHHFLPFCIKQNLSHYSYVDSTT